MQAAGACSKFVPIKHFTVNSFADYNQIGKKMKAMGEEQANRQQ